VCGTTASSAAVCASHDALPAMSRCRDGCELLA